MFYFTEEMIGGGVIYKEQNTQSSVYILTSTFIIYIASPSAFTKITNAEEGLTTCSIHHVSKSIHTASNQLKRERDTCGWQQGAHTQ